MLRRIITFASKFVKAIKKFPDAITTYTSRIPYDHSMNDIKSERILLGKILSSQLKNIKIESLHEVEFSVFSQWGDDGIIQYLIQNIDIPNKTFIEFGVENYRESNTRFLLINNNWSGLVIDGSEKNIDFIQKDIISWGYDLHAKSAFITKENINALISEFLSKGYSDEIGILSIDIDGNDYWIWKEIDVLNPIIVIIEYNSLFGYEKPYTIPYHKDFMRYVADKSLQYYGTSLKAACLLAESKGYIFVGCNLNGNNSYFIRKDKSAGFKSLSVEEGYVKSKFREFFANGERVSGDKRMAPLIGKEVYNVHTGETEIFSVPNKL